MLNQGQKAMHRMAPYSVSLEGKTQNFSFTEQGYDHCLLGCESVIFVDVMPRGETVISDAYIRTLTEVGIHFEEVRTRNINLLSR